MGKLSVEFLTYFIYTEKRQEVIPLIGTQISILNLGVQTNPSQVNTKAWSQGCLASEVLPGLACRYRPIFKYQPIMLVLRIGFRIRIDYQTLFDINPIAHEEKYLRFFKDPNVIS